MKQQNDINVTHSPLPESVEELVRDAAKVEMGVSYEPHMSQIDESFIEGAIFGAKYLQTHHSAEVERLREALKGIGNSAVYMINHEHQTVINSGLINHILETVNLALSQEALKEK